MSDRKIKWTGQQFLLRLTLSLVLGSVGGVAFYLLKLPLPWMLGAMLFTLAGALVGLPVVSAKPVRPPMAAIIGIALGSGFTPATIGNAAAWLPLTATMIGCSLVVGAMGYLYLRHVEGADPVTAYFAAAPGGLYEMTHQGGLAGGDERRIALSHASRIFLIAFLVPVAMTVVGGLGPVNRSLATTAHYPLQDLLVLAACAIGWPIASRLGFPNASLIGPMLVSGLVHAMGVTALSPPPLLVAVAQIVLGASVGGNFIGVKPRWIFQSLLHGSVIFASSMIICGLASLGASAWTGIPVVLVLLSVLPGGMTEMSLIALALGAEVAMISTQHLVRALLVQTLAPMAFMRLRRKNAGA